MLPSIEIKNFRAFQYLKIDKFCQVNLITGKNNVGKTTLLEAIRIFICQHDENAFRHVVDPINKEDFIKHLFYNLNTNNPIEIRCNNRLSDTLTIHKELEKQSIVIQFQNKNMHKVDELEKNRITQDLSRLRYSPDYGSFSEFKKIFFLPTRGIQLDSLCNLWANIELTPLEDYVLQGLQVIDPKVIRFKVDTYYTGDSKENKVIKVRKEGMKSPVTFDSLGGGSKRLYEILISLIHSKDGILLIDEVENGLHYTIQPQIWNLILAISKQLNVQVFATTHSWDCIEAFQEAANTHKEVSSQLIRLDQQNGTIIPTFFSAEELAIATRNDIEVR